MARADAISLLYSEKKSPLEFTFDSLMAPPLYSLIPPNAIAELYKIATSVKLSSKINEKYNLINQIMKQYNFMKLGAGTNRVVYAHYELTHIVAKVAVDVVGLKGSPAEFRNQALLKPFVTKCFDASPCGTVGLFERVQPITHELEFVNIAEDVFNLITSKIIGKYVLEDIGTKFFMNWGIREGFGPCLLDYPSVFELDGKKIYCRKPLNPHDPMSPICDGVIDYDDGFNHLICRTCNSTYFARELSKLTQNNTIIIKGADVPMKVKFTNKKGQVVAQANSTDTYVKPYKPQENEIVSGDLVVRYIRSEIVEEPVKQQPCAPQNVVEQKQIKIDLNAVSMPATKHVVIGNQVFEEVEEVKPQVAEKPASTFTGKFNPGEVLEDQITATDKIELYNRFSIFVDHNFDYERYCKANNEQKEAMINLLMNNISQFDIKSKYTTKSIYTIISDFVENNYRFNDDEEDELPTVYSESGTSITPVEEEEELPKYGEEFDTVETFEKIRKVNSGKSLDLY